MAVCSETYMAVCDEAQKLRAQLEQAEARAAKLQHHADRMLEAIKASDNALDEEAQTKADKLLFDSTEDYLIAKEDDLAADAWLLRKQAEAVIDFGHLCFGPGGYETVIARGHAQRLRQQADELENSPTQEGE